MVLFYVYECFAYLNVFVPCACNALGGQERVLDPPDLELHMVGGPLEEHPVIMLLTTEPSSLSHNPTLSYKEDQSRRDTDHETPDRWQIWFPKRSMCVLAGLSST